MFLENFKSSADVIEEYRMQPDALDNAVIYLAWYGYGDYCGSSFVLFEKDGKLYEVNGSHCSCYGLEGQWEPEETSWEALGMRDLTGSDGGAQEAHDALQKLVKEHTEGKNVQ